MPAIKNLYIWTLAEWPKWESIIAFRKSSKWVFFFFYFLLKNFYLSFKWFCLDAKTPRRIAADKAEARALDPAPLNHSTCWDLPNPCFPDHGTWLQEAIPWFRVSSSMLLGALGHQHLFFLSPCPGRTLPPLITDSQELLSSMKSIKGAWSAHYLVLFLLGKTHAWHCAFLPQHQW